MDTEEAGPTRSEGKMQGKGGMEMTHVMCSVFYVMCVLANVLTALEVTNYMY